jgi:hypothetical protein
MTPDRLCQPVPDGSRLVHIGPHKTGTTAIQAAFWSARAAARAQGVRYAGRSRHPSQAARAVTGQAGTYSEDRPPPIGEWNRLVAEVRAAREPRVVISSELLAWASPEVVARIARDLGPDRIRIAVTLRPLGRILPSTWQQNVQAGARIPFDRWLDGLLATDPKAQRHAFWTLHRHDRLIARWAAVVGASRITAIVADEHDHDLVLRALEDLTGLRRGTLAMLPDRANRSLTLPEAEAVRAFNLAFGAELGGKALHARVMRLGAAAQMKLREPAPDEARIELPATVIARVAEIEQEIVDGIASLGVPVIGDLGSLTWVPAGTRGPDPAGGRAAITPEVAAAMAMGVLLAVGAGRGTAGGPGARPAEDPAVALVPTYQLAGVLGIRAWRGIGRQRRRVGRTLGRRGRAAGADG